MEEVRGMGGDAEVVAAEDEDAVGRNEGVVQSVVVPEDEGGGEVVGVHGDVGTFALDAGRGTTKETKWVVSKRAGGIKWRRNDMGSVAAACGGCRGRSGGRSADQMTLGDERAARGCSRAARWLTLRNERSGAAAPQEGEESNSAE
jgi:hypothetical protein